MYYSSTIEDPLEGFNQIVNATARFNSDRFLYALQYKNWNEKDIERMCQEVSSSRCKLDGEYSRLVTFAKDFNREFATKDNKRFDSALIMLNKIKSGISGTKQIFMKFCPRARKENILHVIGNRPVSAFDYAYISADTYPMDLFQFEGYPSCISSLYEEMEKFFILLISCIRLCKQVLADEKTIKENNQYCKYLLDEFKKKIWKEICDIVMMIPKDSIYLTEESNPAIASRNKYASDEAWAPIGFHNFTRTEVKQLVIKDIIEQQAGSDLTKVEILLLGNDVAKVHKYREIIQHFDELLPASYNRKNISGKYVQMFFQFIGIPAKLEKAAVEYFNEMYNKSPNNTHTTVSLQAINKCKKDVLVDKDGSYKEFADSIKRRFFATLPLQLASNL